MAATVGFAPGFVTIGTVGLEKPVLDASGKPTQKASDWIVEIPDHTKGNIEDFETYAQLFDFHYEYCRETSGHIGNEMFTSAAIEHSEVSLLIPTGTYTAKIRQTLNIGKVVPTITIKRLGNMTDIKKPLQIITYTDCIFARVVQDRDFFAVSFRFIKVKEENPEMKQAEEDSGGQNVCEIDYSKLTVA